jgi:hypothetical protein
MAGMTRFGVSSINASTFPVGMIYSRDDIMKIKLLGREKAMGN